MSRARVCAGETATLYLTYNLCFNTSSRIVSDITRMTTLTNHVFFRVFLILK